MGRWRIAEGQKWCNDCGDVKDEDEFYRYKSGKRKGGLFYRCKDCSNKYNRKKHWECRDERIGKMKRHRDANKDEINKRVRARRKKRGNEIRDHRWQWYHKGGGRERMRWIKMKRDFNMTKDDYEEMLENQDGVCAICGEKETQKRNGRILQLGVDHNHMTGKVRGLLCNKCNQMIGYARDDISILSNAILYLKRYSE